ncbi:GNAT family N-acetyltransferase [Candidatus Woesearchaeota archaeon]|nr:GNAT family N-acetyltransferase [Candidatus Woesearchaeota archaeon]
MSITFEKGDIHLLKEIVLLNESVFRGMYEHEPYSLDHYTERLLKVKPVIYIAKSGNQIIGDAISFERDGSLYLWILAVSPEFRNRGVASTLFNLMEQHARDNGIGSVSTKVYNVSKEMLRLLLKKGYNIVAIEEHGSHPKYNAIHFKLSFLKSNTF